MGPRKRAAPAADGVSKRHRDSSSALGKAKLSGTSSKFSMVALQTWFERYKGM